MKKSIILLMCAFAAAETRLPTVCTYGTYVENPMTETECKDCPEGKYRDTVLWDVPCKDCPAGKVSGAGSIDCQNSTLSDTEEEEASSVVAAGGVGVAAGATLGVVYYTSST